MRRAVIVGPALALMLAGTEFAAAQQQQPAPDPATQPFAAGPALELSPNVKVYGSFRFAESCVYDEARDLYITPNAGIAQDTVPNDGFVSLINPDGSVNNLKWIGVNRNGLTLNHPLGSDIANGMLYVADIDTIRWFDLATGEPKGSAAVTEAAVLNDIEVAADGTIYASQHGNQDGTTPWRLYKVTPDGTSSVFVDGGPLKRPNGVAIDPAGNIVVVNIGSDEILTFSPAGELLKTEKSLDSGNDGLVILADGTMYVSSVVNGKIARIRPGQAPELVASGIPSAASICYDSKRNRIIAPMNNGNAIAIVELN